MAREDLEQARIRLYQKADRSKFILGISTALLVVFGFIAFLNLIKSVEFSFRAPAADATPDQVAVQNFLNWLVIAILSFIGPYGFYNARKQREIKQVERRLPDFLRDVAEAGRFGMTLADAIVVSSSGRYGKLTPEIKKMAAQISWGVPATEALHLFAERVKTPMVQRVVAIIVKSSDAGGDVADVLTMVSHDTKENQLTEDERRIAMSTYVAVIYISFMVFLVTIWILNVTFLPKMVEASGSLAGTTALAGSSPLAENLPDVVYQIKIAFFVATIVHGLGDGILAGVLDNGKIPTGLRHSFIMLLIALFGFLLI
ncbi:MAG TPA: type II secretion system F family protein [Thermoplasmata archaeon]|nr:type II secretion system F family protein [Thermoplasmata archaeon]